MHYQQFLTEISRAVSGSKNREEYHELVDMLNDTYQTSVFDLPQTLGYIDKFLELDPDVVEAWNWKAIMLSQHASESGETETNNQYFQDCLTVIDEEVLKRSPNHWRALIGKAEVYAKLQDWAAAKEALDVVLEINPWSSTDKNFHYMYRFYLNKIQEEEMVKDVLDTVVEEMVDKK